MASWREAGAYGRDSTSMTTVIVTGGSGFIGTNLVEHHLRLGHRVINFDVCPPSNPEHRDQWRKTDILDADDLTRMMAEADPQIVYHMAARTDLFGNSVDDYRANTTGVANVIAALRGARNLQLGIFASSMLVCRIGYQPCDELDYCPSTAYGESKVIGERLVREQQTRSLPWVIVRPTSIWGPWFGAPYRDFFTAVKRGLYVHPRSQRIRRNYGFVLNSVAQLERLATTAGGGLLNRTVYLADYEPIELKNWADGIQRALQVKPIKELPLWLFRGAAKVGDLMKFAGYPTPPMSSYRLNNMLTEMVHDTGPLQAVLPMLPYSTEQGIYATCQWLKQQTL